MARVFLDDCKVVVREELIFGKIELLHELDNWIEKHFACLDIFLHGKVYVIILGG
jgi:hypothetical protein